MAEAGSFAERVKQQADIVRVIGEYVRLKKSGANFTGLCPFHQEKTPSFAVHPVKQIYHCFGCGAGGDVFKFVMEMEKSSFPEAIRTVAEKCGIAIPKPRERSPEERRENQQRGTLLDLHRDAAAFFARQLHETNEGKVAAAYLDDMDAAPYNAVSPAQNPGLSGARSATSNSLALSALSITAVPSLVVRWRTPLAPMCWRPSATVTTRTGSSGCAASRAWRRGARR